MFFVLFLVGVGASAFAVGMVAEPEEDTSDTAQDDVLPDSEKTTDLLEGTDEDDIFLTEDTLAQLRALDQDVGQIPGLAEIPDDGIILSDTPDNIDAQDGDDLILGSGEDDTIAAGAGDDIAFGNDGDDFISLGDGDDISGIGDEDLQDIPSLYRDLVAGNDTILGGAGDDTISDTQGANIIDGNDGDDVLIALDDAILENEQHVAPMADTVSGGAGDDTIIGDEGDLLAGGEGSDVFYLANLTPDALTPDYIAATITDFVPGEDTLVLEGRSEMLIRQVSEATGLYETDPITIAPDASTENSVISIRGIPVLTLEGVPDLQRSDIQLSLT